MGHHGIDGERLTAECDDLVVVGDGLVAHRAGEPGGVEHLTGADADAAGLVGVGRADALQCGADALVAAAGLVQRVERLVPREDEVALAADLQLGAGDAAALECVDLLEERGQIDHDAVADHRDDVRVEHARRGELQGVALGSHDHGVARVVAALVADDVAVFGGEQVDDLGLALVAPLGAYDNSDGHWQRSSRVTGT